MPRISQAPTTSRRSGSAASSRQTASDASRASSFSAVARPPRVGSRSQRTASPSSSSDAASSCTGAVSLSSSTSSASSPRATITAMPWSPSVPETSTRSPGQDAAGAEPHAFGDQADPGRVEVEPVCLAALDDLRVAGRDDHPGGLGSARHRAGEPAQPRHLEALLDHEPGREHERPCAGDGQVVHRPVDRELADVAAGELERLDDVRVGREREPRAVQLEQRRVAERVEQRVAELLEEEPLDERA